MIAERIATLGKGTVIAKLDIQSAFRIVPVHPADCHLLGMRWKDSVYIDTVLPFELRSAPKLFNAVADAIQFIAGSQGIKHITHYLDDFVILGPPGTLQCHRDLQVMIEICQRLGTPLAREKLEGPAMRLEILGIIFDTQAMQLSLPHRKLTELKSILQVWQGRKAARKVEIQSLAGKLQHAAKAIRPGRCFVRQIYELTKVKGGQNQMVRLKRDKE